MVETSEYLLKQAEEGVNRENIVKEMRHQEQIKQLKELGDDLIKSLK